MAKNQTGHTKSRVGGARRAAIVAAPIQYNNNKICMQNRRWVLNACKDCRAFGDDTAAGAEGAVSGVSAGGSIYIQKYAGHHYAAGIVVAGGWSLPRVEKS